MVLSVRLPGEVMPTRLPFMPARSLKGASALAMSA